LVDKFENHKNFQNFVKALNLFYKNTSPLWKNDDSWEGFKWISSDDYKQSIIAFRRIDDDQNEIITVCNFVPVGRDEYRIGVPEKGTYFEIFNSTSAKFGGDEISNGNIKSEAIPMHDCDNSICLKIPPLSVVFFKKRKTLERKQKKEN